MVRYTRYGFAIENGKSHKPVLGQSDWTPLQVKSPPAGERERWLSYAIKNLPTSPGLLVVDALPSLLAWCLERKIELVHIQPCKPMQNGRCESFNGRLREECLRVSWFENLFDARRKIADWKKDYNEQRPHSSLGYRTPMEFAAEAAGFVVAEAGQEASNAGPLPRTPIPAECEEGMEPQCRILKSAE